MTKINPSKIKFLLIGEIHGIRENLKILKVFVDLYFKKKINFIIAFEWPAYLSREINDYILGKTNILAWKGWEFINNRDGRISKEHIAFLSWLRKKNIKLSKDQDCVSIICFDENADKWNERDRLMGNNIKKAERNVIAIMGNPHAAKSKFKLDKERHVPLGYHLPRKQTVAVKIIYRTGKFYNHGIHNIRKQDRAKLGLSKSKKVAGFDYVYMINMAHPTSPLK